MEQLSPKVLTNKVQTYIKKYFYREDTFTKAESKSLQQMAFGILKSKSIFVNQIASALGEKITLKKTAKRLSKQYLKGSFADKVLQNHIESLKHAVTESSYIIWDGTDISKKQSRCLEGLDYVHDGDKKEVGLGFNVLNIIAINIHNEITPLYSKAYSFALGALSQNKESTQFC